MAAGWSIAERFLVRFHDARPGLASKVFATLPLSFRGQIHASSYEVLAGAVSRTSRPAGVLDLACGDGFLLSLLASRMQPGLALGGVDFSAGELAVAARRPSLAVPLVRARAQALPYGNACFDAVLCHMALMLMDDLDQVLHEVRRVLVHGGTFTAILGANPPPCPVLSHYLDVLSGHTRDLRWSTVRFGDVRLRTREGIADLLARTFNDVVVEEIRIPLRFSPQELWLWLLDMYDLYLFNAQDRETIRQELFEAVAPECARDGRLEFTQAMHYVSTVST